MEDERGYSKIEKIGEKDWLVSISLKKEDVKTNFEKAKDFILRRRNDENKRIV